MPRKDIKVPRMFALKLLYFLQAAGAAPILPFLPLIVKNMGVSGSGFGFSLALVGIIGILARPFLARLVDYYPKVLCYRMIMLGAIMGFVMMSLLPSIKQRELNPNLYVHGCDNFSTEL